MISSRPFVERAANVELEGCLGEGLNAAALVGPMHQPESPRDAGGDQHTDQDRAADFFDFERDHEDEAEESERGGGVADVSEADESGRIADDEAGVAESDERDEEADAAGDGGVEFVGNRTQDHLADAGGGERKKNDAGEKHRAECGLPGDVHLEADGVSEVGVEAHAGGEGDGIARDDAHENGTESRGEAGGGGDSGKRHARGRKNGGVDEHDVGHREKGRYAGEDLGAPVGSQMCEFKIAFKELEHRWVSLEEHRRGAAQRDLCPGHEDWRIRLPLVCGSSDADTSPLSRPGRRWRRQP